MQNCSMLPHDVFSSIVRHAPLVSIDLVIRNPRGEILVGFRRNRPAQGYWFVPGGRIGKGERIAEAFARITRGELGTEHRIENAVFLGVFEHIYEDNFSGDPSFGPTMSYSAMPSPQIRLRSHHRRTSITPISGCRRLTLWRGRTCMSTRSGTSSKPINY